jgi:glycerate 2-kinase
VRVPFARYRSDEDKEFSLNDPREFLLRMLKAAIYEALPATRVKAFLPAPPVGRTIVVGAGKAAASMAAALEASWNGPVTGLVVTRYGHGASTHQIEVVEASHPKPDSAGETAARRMVALVSGLSEDDLVICLMSGGGSALASLPAPGLRLEDKIAINEALLRSGATIAEINTVRKHLSSIKGGRLAVAAAPARVVSLIVSDVPGDDLSIIASGPTVADPTTREQAVSVLMRYRIDLSPAVASFLSRPEAETPKPGHRAFQRVDNRLIVTSQLSLEAAAQVAREQGVEPVLLGDAIEGEAREVAKVFAAIAKSAKKYGAPGNPPCVLLSGGETTVTVRGQGRGGRNTEFQLGLALAIDSEPGIWALAADTDGVDGSEDNAGAFVSPDTLLRARGLRKQPREYLDDNDAYSFFAELDDLVITGPTLTNVNDFRAILIT